MATPAEIEAAFRWLLGRTPDAVELAEWTACPVENLRDRLMATEAFATVLPAHAVRLRQQPEPVAWDAPEAEVASLLARVQAHWTRLGDRVPHWSVVAEAAFLPNQIDANQLAFQASGERDVAQLVATLAQHGWQPADLPRVMDFGCGVGRMTRAMQAVFASVAGCDISPSHLALARAACGPGVRFSLVNAVDGGMEAPFDLWFSTRTLQHNPPPITGLILRRAFTLLAPGGAAVFQLPTARVGYRFDIAAPDPVEDLPIHAFPQAAVFALAAEAGCIPVEVIEDSAVWPPLLCRSNSFVIRKPRS